MFQRNKILSEILKSSKLDLWLKKITLRMKWSDLGKDFWKFEETYVRLCCAAYENFFGESSFAEEKLGFWGMTMSATVSPMKPARGRGPADGRAFFETLWRGGNFLLDRQKVLKRSRRRKLHAAANNGKKKQQQQLLQLQRQHCCCCQRIQLHLLAGRRSNMRSVVRWLSLKHHFIILELCNEIPLFYSKYFFLSTSLICNKQATRRE